MKNSMILGNDWERMEKVFWQVFVFCAIALAMPTAYFFAWWGMGFYLIGAGAFAVEFKLIVVVARLLLGIIRGNMMAIAMIFAAKLSVWLALASAPFWLPKGAGWPFGLGCLAFALALASLMVFVGGRPRLEKR